jgi:hypothetical protein
VTSWAWRDRYFLLTILTARMYLTGLVHFVLAFFSLLNSFLLYWCCLRNVLILLIFRADLVLIALNCFTELALTLLGFSRWIVFTVLVLFSTKPVLTVLTFLTVG